MAQALSGVVTEPCARPGPSYLRRGGISDRTLRRPRSELDGWRGTASIGFWR